VKLAIVMARRGVGREEAEALLATHAGRLRAIVGDPPPVPS
jgi:N-acetylmuramic acid 6-phosphate (MurNAc-6-P) etherase